VLCCVVCVLCVNCVCCVWKVVYSTQNCNSSRSHTVSGLCDTVKFLSVLRGFFVLNFEVCHTVLKHNTQDSDLQF